MKKIIFSVFVLGILLPMLVLASFDTSLKYGSRGDAVIELQDFLQDQGVYSGKVDGRFGLGTRKAVIAFQTANGLSPDGYFGKASRSKASDILATILQPSNEAEQADTGAIAPVTSTVAGCTSTSAYSATTGQPCNSTIQPSASAFPAGCTSTSGFSITTGQACNNIVSTVQQLQQTVQQQTQTIQQIQQNTQQLVQNTTPPVITPLPTPTPIDICPNITGVQTTVPSGMIINSSSNCVIPLQVDTTPPNILSTEATYADSGGYASIVHWPNGHITGDVNDHCRNCLFVKTNEPSRVKVSYMDFNNPTFHTNGWEINNSTNYRMPVMEQEANNPSSVSSYQDNTLSTLHAISYLNIGIGSGKYYYSVEVSDEAGNIKREEFTASAIDPNIYHWNLTHYLEIGLLSL